MASRSIFVRSSSHHGSESSEKRVTRKRSPNIRNLISTDNGSTLVPLVLIPTAVFYSRIKSRDESHAPTVATSSVENGGQPQGDAPEKEI